MNQLSKVVVASVFLYHTFTAAHGQAGASSEPAAQPPDLHFALGTEDGRTEFHLGEIIVLEEAYSSDAPGKYLLVSSPAKLHGGHSAEVRMQPDEHVIDRIRDSGIRTTFSVLHVNCSGGIGSGSGGSYGEGAPTRPLKSTPIRFPYVLTAQFQIMEPGRYFIHAEAANVVLAPFGLENSVPISLTSNTVEIDIVDDSLWSREKLEEAVTSFDNAHSQYLGKGWNTLATAQANSESRGAQISLESNMQSAAETMRVLDTEESLAEIIRRYDPVQNPDYFNHALLSGIIQSKHQALAVKLLAARILEPDFSVSKDLLDQLTAMALENQFPGSLADDDIQSRRRYYPEARRILHDYILALGKSLPEKSENALGPSLATFKWYAKEDFCSGESLVPGAAFRTTLRQVQAFDSEPEP